MMSHPTLSSVGRIKLRQGRLSRALRRGTWKLVNVLVVAAMLLPNFTFFADQALAAEAATIKSEQAERVIAANDHLSWLEKTFSHPKANLVIGQVDSVRLFTQKTAITQPMLLQAPAPTFYTGFEIELTGNEWRTCTDGGSYTGNVKDETFWDYSYTAFDAPVYGYLIYNNLEDWYYSNGNIWDPIKWTYSFWECETWLCSDPDIDLARGGSEFSDQYPYVSMRAWTFTDANYHIGDVMSALSIDNFHHIQNNEIPANTGIQTGTEVNFFMYRGSDMENGDNSCSTYPLPPAPLLDDVVAIYPIHYGIPPDPIPLRSALSACSPKSGTGDTRECALSSSKDAQGYVADPINTYTGGFDYSIVDLSLPTTAADLVFQHTYSSLATELYTTTMGYGWAHNHDTRLIFSDDDPLGEEDTVWFKGHTTNQYKFRDNGDDTFDEFPGVLATLELNGDYYEVTDPSQNVYLFYDGDGADSGLKGRLFEWQTPEGFSFSYTYDANGLLDQVEGPHDQILSFDYTDYSGIARLTSVSDNTGPNGTTGREVFFAYDLTSGDLITVTDVLDAEWVYGYKDDANHPHLLETITDPRSTIILTTTYDTEGRAISQEDALNTLAEITYNDDRSSIIENGRAFTTTHTYNGLETLVGETNPSNHAVGKEYDRNFRPTVISNTYQTELLWSNTGANLEQITNADGKVTDLDYDSLNNLTAFTDPRENITTYGYSETLLISTTNALDQTTAYTYTTASDAPQPEGLLKEISTPLGTTEFEYNSSGQLVTTTDALDRESSYAYNDQGWLESVSDPAGRTNWTCYDLAGRVVRTVVNASGGDACNPAYQPSGEPDEDRITIYHYDVVGNLIATEDPAGRITRTYYDDANRPVTVVQNLVGQAINVATPPARDAVHDQNIRTDTGYDENSNVTQTIGNDVDQKTYYCYDELDRHIKTIQNPTGAYAQVCTPGYVPSSVTDEDIINITEYDDLDNIVKTTDNDGNETQTCYDNLNRSVRTVFNPAVSDPCGSYTPNAAADQDVINDTKYDANGNVIASIEWLVEDGQVTSRTTRTYYNVLNQPNLVFRNLTYQGWEVETPPPSSAFGNEENVAVETIYSPISGLAIATVEYLVEDSQVVSYTTRTYYDDLGRTETVVRNLTNWSVANEQPPTESSRSNDENVTTQTVYDPDSGQAIAQIAWLVEDSTVISRTMRTYYDDLGRTIAVVQNLTGDPDSDTWPAFNPSYPDQNVRTEMVYDAVGNQIATKEVLAEDNIIITRSYYDDIGRTETVVRNLTGSISDPPPSRNPNTPDENVRTDTQYDASGNMVVQTDALGYDTNFEYDDLNHQTQVSDSLSQATTYTYNNAGQLRTMTDAEGTATRYQYDGLGRLTSVTENYQGSANADHETNVETHYTYDKSGNLKSIEDANGHVADLDYDDLNRLESESDPLSNTWAYAYDARGNRTQTTDANGAVITYAYDALGRQTGIDYPSPDAEVSFSYNALGWRTGMSDGLGSTDWDYDGLGHPISITDPFTQTIGYQYDVRGLRTGLDYPDSKSVSYDYDALGRLEEVTDWNAQITSYTYDQAGQLKIAELPNGVTSTYIYNDVGWLSQLAHTNDTETLSSFGYQYDYVGNRTSVTETLREPVSLGGIDENEKREPVIITYDYDPLYRLTDADYDDGAYFDYSYDAVGNRLTLDSDQSAVISYQYDAANRLTSVDKVAYTWDANGNLLYDGANDYIYDHANRLVHTNPHSGIYTYDEYAYNGLGDRLSHTHSEPSGDVTTHYTLDLALGLTQVLADGSNTYHYGLGRIAQHAHAAPSTPHFDYYLADALGSVRQLTDASGAVTLAQSYRPFGDTLSSEGDGSSVFQYTGEMRDSTGLTYLRARYLDTSVGRFTSRDTWKGDYNRPLSLNRWTYVEGNPVNRIDPTGNYTIFCGGNGFDGFDLKRRVTFAEWVMGKDTMGNNDPALWTYVAAGIAIQCAGTSWPHPLKPHDWVNTGVGPAQVSWNQISTIWGEPFYDVTFCDNKVGRILTQIFGQNSGARGYGLRLRDPETGELEKVHNPFSRRGAAYYMWMRIKLVLDECANEECTPTDMYIAAALAQNGPGFTHEEFGDIDVLSTPNKDRENYGISRKWQKHFERSQAINARTQLFRFNLIINELKSRGWYVPAEINDAGIKHFEIVKGRDE